MDFLHTWIVFWISFLLCNVATSDTGCGGKPADIIFLLDTSSSIWGPNFRKQIRFVHNVIKQFDTSEDSTRIAVLTFGSSVREEVALGGYGSKKELYSLVNSIQHQAGDTRTEIALHQANSIFRTAGRPEVPHIVIVMTDGLSDYPGQTQASAKQLKQDGTIIFTIGIGQEAHSDELQNIASSPDVVFKVDTYDALKKLKKMLAHKACNVQLAEKAEKGEANMHVVEPQSESRRSCGGIPADVVFAMDASSSIWGPDFNKQLQFVLDIIEVFDIGLNTTHVGVLSFGSYTTSHMQLSPNQKYTDIVKSISSIRQIRGETNTAAALDTIRTQYFSERHSPRKDIVRVAIIITDGKSDIPEATARQAKLLREHGVHIFAVGVGQGVEMHELKNIASSPATEYVATVNNYGALDSIKELLAIKACQVTVPTTTPEPTTAPTTTPSTTTTEIMLADQGCGGQSPVDVVFALPPSSTEAQTRHGIQFLKDFIRQYGESDDNVRIGLVPRDCLAVPGFSLQSTHNSDLLSDMLTEDQQQYAAASVANSIRYMREKSFRVNKGTKRIGIVMLDNKLSHRKAAALEALRAKEFSDIELFVVNIGKGVSSKDSQILSSVPHDSHVFSVSSYEELPALAASLKSTIDELCHNAL